MSAISTSTPKLGNVFSVTITSPDLDKSFAFYKQLGFSEVIRTDFPFPLCLISDGSLLILLRKDPNPFISLTYFVKELDKIVSELEKEGIVFTIKPKGNDMIKRYMFQSPDGANIGLVTHVEGFENPAGPSMLKMNPQDYFKPEKYTNKTIGLFGEFAHPVKDLAASISFWEKLGFKAVSKFESPYKWAIISDGLSVVGLHQTDHFSVPIITYFAADMKEKIEKLKAAGMMEFNEFGGGANSTITTPENQKINLFKLGM
jgi:predicted lactoylglutathione lyase